MASFLKSIDMYSTKFNFTIGRESGYSTIFGSILTLITGILFVVLFIILGKDFLYKENARTSSSKFIAPDGEIISLRNWNITLAISLQKPSDLGAWDLDLNGGFFWSDFTYSRNYYNETLEEYVRTSQSLRLEKCSNLSYTPSMTFPKEFYCLEFPADSYFGSNANESYTYFYSIFNCEKKVPNGIPGTKCNSLETLQKTFKQENSVSFFFYVYHPVLYYDPRDKARPALVNYELLNFPFDFNLQRKDTLNFHKTIVNEDKGWWFEENHNETFWTVESKDYSFDYKSNEDLMTFLASSKFYELGLSMSTKHNYYTRSYMKIQDVLAVVATIVKILMIIFEVICLFINTSFIRYHIFKKLFSSVKTIIPKSNVSVYSNNNISKFNLVNASKSKECPPSTLMVSKVTPFSPIHRKPFSIKSKSKTFNRCFAFKRSIGSWMFRRNEKALVERWDQGDEIVKDKMDIDNYLRMIHDLIILQKSVFNDPQFYSLNFLKRVNIFNQKEIENYFNPKKERGDEVMRRYASYFSNQNDRGENSELKDKLILGLMKESYKTKLFSKKQIDLS